MRAAPDASARRTISGTAARSPAPPPRRSHAPPRAAARREASGAARLHPSAGSVDTARLWISRTPETVIAAACTRSRSAASSSPGSTWTTTSLPGSARCTRGLDAIGGGMTLSDAVRWRDADHDVGERAGRAAWRSRKRTQLDRRLERHDRLSRGVLGVGRRAIHQHVDVAAHQPPGGDEHEHARRTGRRSSRPAGSRRGDTRPPSTASRADEVAAEVERVRARAPRSRSARGARGGPTCARASIAITTRDCREDPPGRLDLALDRSPPSRATASAATTRLTSASTDASASAARCSALPCPYWWPASAGRTGDADREEREQRGDEVGAGVQRLGDEAEAAAREPDAELEREQHDRRADRDERGSALRRHAARLDAAASYKLPRRACSRSIDSKRALKFPSPKVVAPWRSITSKNMVGRSWAVFVKIWSR